MTKGGLVYNRKYAQYVGNHKKGFIVLLRTFRWPVLITIGGLLGAFLLGGWSVFLIVAILSILEVSLSFDNAVINARVLERMSPFWQKIFLTVGIAIAVFGMRLVFPLLIVGLTAHLGPQQVLTLAMDPTRTYEGMTYSQHLTEAHPAIAAFGGMFLLMIFLEFIFEEREIKWLRPLERALAKIGKLDVLSVILALVMLLLANQFIVPADEHLTVLFAGVLGLVTYLTVNGLGKLFESQGDEELEDEAEKKGSNGLVLATGKAAFFLFLYLEVLDASFSFDGVIGAFAVTQNIWVIATGLGIGAMYIRSLTVYLVRKGTLDNYVYLEHGAHYAIGALAVLLFVTIEYHIPEVVTGLIGVGFIGAAFISSLVYNKRNGSENNEPAIETAKTSV